MIPDLTDGVLPEGLHECTMEEVSARFGRFQRSDRRVRLTEKLLAYVREARLSDTAVAVVIDGSYVTAKPEPGDIDVVLALRPDEDLTADLRPMDYNVRSRRMVRKLYGFDVRIAEDGSPAYWKLVDFFARVRLDEPMPYTNQARKGMLRVML